MTLDITSALGAVTREVETRELDGKPARVIIASRTYDTTVEDLWDALTNPERVPRWFGGVSGDLQLGGRYQIEGNASGEITECEPPRHLALTWEWQGTLSWVVVQLEESSPSTSQLRLEHIAHIPEQFWNQYGPGAGGVGWELALVALESYLADGEAEGPPQEGSRGIDHQQEWLATEQGKRFVSQCSDAWGQASIAAGTDEDAAMAAAARTTEFYSGGQGA